MNEMSEKYVVISIASLRSDLETATKDRDELVTALKESVAMNELNNEEWEDNYFENQSKQESHQALLTRIEQSKEEHEHGQS